MMGRPWDAAPPAHQQPAGLVSKCGAAYPGGPTHILNPPSKGGLVSSSREREGCSRTRPLKAKPCQVHDVTTTDTKPDLHHGCIPVGIAVARQRIQPYTPPLVSDDTRCLSGSGSQISCQLQSQGSCSQLGSCSQPALNCAQQALGCTQPLSCAQPTLGCTVQPPAPQLCASQAPTPWALPPPHHHWAHPPYQGVESCGLPPVGLQLHRDPMTGHLILLPNSVDNRGSVMWSGAPPSLQVMTPTQPLLLGDRFVALAHHDRRRPPNEHSSLAGVMVPCDFSKATGGTSGGREVSQQQVLIQQVPAGSQQVVLSSQLVEQSLGTSLVISNHQLSENTLTLSPHLVPVDTGFQPTATGLVISHTETNSFLRSDINTVFPVNGNPVIKEEIKPDITDTKNLVISPQPQEVFSEPIEEKVELHKGSVADASNQTETPNVSDEDSSDKPLAMNIKEEKKDVEQHAELPQVIKTEKEEMLEENVQVNTVEKVDSVNCHEEPQITEEVIDKEVDEKVVEQSDDIEDEEKVHEGPDLSGLELLSNSIMQFGSRIEEESEVQEAKEEVVTSQVEEKVEESSNVEEEETKSNHEDPMLGGLGLLCELAHLRFIEETQKEHCIEEVVEKKGEKASESDSPVLQVSVPPKKRPGRPRKSPNRVKNNRELPPVLEPAWSSNSSWSSTPALSPPTLSPHKRKPSPPALEEEESVGSPTVSSSKKRKVGRPRKRDDTPDQTETIVAKTNLMSSKAIVGLLLANQASSQASNQHKIRPKLKAETKVKDWRDEDEDLSPGKLESASIISPTLKVPSYNPEPAKKKLKLKTPSKSTPVTSVPLIPIVPKKNKQCENSVKAVSNFDGQIVNKTKASFKDDPPCYYKGEKVESSDPFSNKIILKKDLTLSPTKEVKRMVTNVNKDVKKEPILVTLPTKEKSEGTVTKENVKKECLVTKEVPKEIPVTSNKEMNKSITPLSKEVSKKETPVGPKETPKRATDTRVKKEERKETHVKELRKSDTQLTSPKTSSEELTVPNASDGFNDPTFTMDHLSSLPRRVLFTLGGLLYAGQLTEVTPPDLYSVTLDKERGHKPHILAAEQILTDTMLELKCEGMSLAVGTRLCAYWSQQYRCLYPGTLYEPASPTDAFVSVEFDDGDNGKINRNDVRLLPRDYPVSEYNPNPLHGISQRKRNNSSTSSDSHPKTEISQTESLPVLSPQINDSDPTKFNEQPKIKEEEKENENINEEKKKKCETVSKTDSEEERRRLKRKKKKMELKKLLANESVWQDLLKYKRKHREQYKMRHKHKHKHRHKKHKHRRSRSCGERVVTEPEPIKPLIVKVHNLPPPEVKPEERDEEEEEEPEEEQEEEEEELKEEEEELKEEEEELKEEEEELKEEEEQKVVKNKKNKTQKRDTSIQSKTEEPSSKPSMKKAKKERQGSIESKSKMAVFLPARQLWTWHGKGFKRGKGPSPRARKKIFYKSIKRQDEIISVGDCAVFLSTGRPDRPYIGKIEQMWECWGSTMLVKVSWFYHPEETIPKTTSLPFPGGLFESPHIDENDVQTISHKCDVLSFEEFKAKIDVCPELATNVYDNNDTYYLAGSYDPTHSNLTLLPQVNQN